MLEVDCSGELCAADAEAGALREQPVENMEPASNRIVTIRRTRISPLIHTQESFIPFTVLQLYRRWLVTPVVDPWILHRQTLKVMRGSLHCYKNEAKRKPPWW